MPRTLSGIKDAEFDTLTVSEALTTQDLETQGTFSHTGLAPAQFDTLNVGSDGDTGVKMTVYGNIACSQITTTGLEAELKFQNQGSTATAQHTYNGATDILCTPDCSLRTYLPDFKFKFPPAR